MPLDMRRRCPGSDFFNRRRSDWNPNSDSPAHRPEPPAAQGPSQMNNRIPMRTQHGFSDSRFPANWTSSFASSSNGRGRDFAREQPRDEQWRTPLKRPRYPTQSFNGRDNFFVPQRSRQPHVQFSNEFGDRSRDSPKRRRLEPPRAVSRREFYYAQPNEGYSTFPSAWKSGNNHNNNHNNTNYVRNQPEDMRSDGGRWRGNRRENGVIDRRFDSDKIGNQQLRNRDFDSFNNGSSQFDGDRFSRTPNGHRFRPLDSTGQQIEYKARSDLGRDIRSWSGLCSRGFHPRPSSRGFHGPPFHEGLEFALGRGREDPLSRDLRFDAESLEGSPLTDEDGSPPRGGPFDEDERRMKRKRRRRPNRRGQRSSLKRAERDRGRIRVWDSFTHTYLTMKLESYAKGCIMYKAEVKVPERNSRGFRYETVYYNGVSSDRFCPVMEKRRRDTARRDGFIRSRRPTGKYSRPADFDSRGTFASHSPRWVGTNRTRRQEWPPFESRPVGEHRPEGIERHSRWDMAAPIDGPIKDGREMTNYPQLDTRDWQQQPEGSTSAAAGDDDGSSAAAENGGEGDNTIVHFRWEKGMLFTPYIMALRHLGEGTFGRVLECWDSRRNQRVALKVIRNVSKYAAAAQTEADILSVISRYDPMGSSPCVKLFEVFKYRNTNMCLEFERLGSSLFDYLSINKFRGFYLADIQVIADDIFKGLCFLSMIQLVHTDLKLENILFVDDASDIAPTPRPDMFVGSQTRDVFDDSEDDGLSSWGFNSSPPLSQPSSHGNWMSSPVVSSLHDPTMSSSVSAVSVPDSRQSACHTPFASSPVNDRRDSSGEVIDDSQQTARVTGNEMNPSKNFEIVFRPKNPHISLIDFGGATFMTGYHNSLINTRQYRSPEVILDLSWDLASDLWCVGCILIELYTGDLFFKTHDHLEHLHMMELACGPFPQHMLKAAYHTRGRKYVVSSADETDDAVFENMNNDDTLQECTTISKGGRWLPGKSVQQTKQTVFFNIKSSASAEQAPDRREYLDDPTSSFGRPKGETYRLRRLMCGDDDRIATFRSLNALVIVPEHQEFLDLVESLLVLDPDKRLPANQGLHHKFFRTNFDECLRYPYRSPV